MYGSGLPGSIHHGYAESDNILSFLTDMITLGDLKACKLTPVFLNTFTNVEKYLDYEQRDPVTMSKVC